MKWPCRREPALPQAEQRDLGNRLKKALDKAADQAGIKPGGFPGDDGERENDEE